MNTAKDIPITIHFASKFAAASFQKIQDILHSPVRLSMEKFQL
jgi:hypothetical protein